MRATSAVRGREGYELRSDESDRFQQLEGVLVVLSEGGRLEACYLGSEPGMFVAPPLHPRGYDYAAAEQQLAELRSQLSRGKDAGEISGDVRFRAAPATRRNVPTYLTDGNAQQRIEPARRPWTRS